ncbi:MAG: type II toxin-antitoxin system death-on-curing family toxin [Nitrospirae bacterium]|nr:type II toxin-antitoxin system death-on-curing family toxin [Nitrospirota bacterium]
MKITKTSVQRLAHEANLPIDDVRIMLMDGAINLGNKVNDISKEDFKKARRLLGLDDISQRKQLSDLSLLAKRFSLSEDELRNLLYEKGLLTKKRLKRIPHALLSRAEKLVGDFLNPRPKKIQVEKATEPLENIEKGKKKRTKRNRKDKWRIVGPIEEDITYLTPKDVEYIHWILVEDFKSSKDPVEPPGVRSEALLASALSRPTTSLGLETKYPTIAMAGAALLHAIVNNHAFHNGNKRTALVALLVFLDKNGWKITLDQDSFYDYLIAVASHNLIDKTTAQVIIGSDPEVMHIANALQNNIKRIRLGEYPLQFRQLKSILAEYDCEFDTQIRGSNKLKITCRGLQTILHYEGDGREVDPQTIHRIRRELQLDEAHGCDSDIFYNKGPRIPDFINRYRKLLYRLAKV